MQQHRAMVSSMPEMLLRAMSGSILLLYLLSLMKSMVSVATELIGTMHIEIKWLC